MDERIRRKLKSYKNLYKEFVSEGNIRTAIRLSSLGKRSRSKVRKYYEHPENHIKDLQRYATHFHNAKHSPKEIYDGIRRKKRKIVVPTYREQIIHHMCVNVLKPIFMKGMYEHSYASIPNRGAHRAKKFIERWIRKDLKNTKYCLKMDIRKFFESVPHDILKKKLARIIQDDDFLKVMFEIIDATESGLPIGFYTSQWLANWYLQNLDHYIKERLGAKYYVRYMDDMVILGSNKRKLHKMRLSIVDFLHGEGLEMKDNWRIFRITEKTDLDFMGFRFFRNRTTLRRSIFLKARRKARRIAKKAKATTYDARQMLSYLGWLDCMDTYNAYLKYIKPYIDFGYLKLKISTYDRRRTACGN